MAEKSQPIPPLANRLRDCAFEGGVPPHFLTSGSNLGHVLDQVDKLSQSFKAVRCPEHQKFSDALQLAVSCAVQQTLMERELRALALTDDLTGLYNRRGFTVSATQQLKLVHRNHREVLLLFCDVDGLKQINDLFGHAEGDRALLCVADALVETFRSSDILARLGGDEFAVLALETSRQCRNVIVDRIAHNLKKAYPVGTGYELSLSVGVSRFDTKHPLPLGELIAQADQAMYIEKRRRKQTSSRISF